MRSPSAVRHAITVAVTVVSALVAVASPAAAATSLYVVVSNGNSEIWKIDPTTGTQLAAFVAAATGATRPGLAFNGTELFYSDENTTDVRVFDTSGTLLRTLTKPAGADSGNGLGVSATSLYLVGFDDKVHAIDPVTGASQGDVTVVGAQHALTYAGSRGTFFIGVNDSATIQERNPAGALVNTITITPAEVFRGLAFSSSSNTLFGVRSGKLWSVNPDTGAILTGPIDINDGAGALATKAGAAAADEVVSCGDGTVTAPETCDPPGSAIGGTTCRADCTYCGDGVQQTPEACDDGAGNSDDTPGACRTDCTEPICGDGVTDPGEGCDDGNQNDDDACRNDCTPPFCGDGVLDPGEICDDGNQVDTDGCRNNCTLPFCGDGILDPTELCDDGNSNDEDGCDSDCVPEICGDGIVQPGLGEQCDPPLVNGCDANCHLPVEICTDFVDNDNDGIVDCLDPDCDCPPIGRDPGAIRFGGPGKGDLLTVHGSFVPVNGGVNPLTEEIGLRLTNQHGKVFEIRVPPGTLRQIGRNLFRFKDRMAQRNRDGLARLDVRFFPRRGNLTFVIKVYGDLSAATEAEMGTQWVVGDDPFFYAGRWQKTPKGWLLTLPGE